MIHLDSHEKSIPSHRLGMLWRKTNSLLPLVFRFPPSITVGSQEEVESLLSTIIIMKHSSDVVSEYKHKLDELRNKLHTVESFIEKHEKIFGKGESTGDRTKIMYAFREALESIYRINDIQM